MRGPPQPGCCRAESDPSERFQRPSPRSSETPAGTNTNISDYSLKPQQIKALKYLNTISS